MVKRLFVVLSGMIAFLASNLGHTQAPSSPPPSAQVKIPSTVEELSLYPKEVKQAVLEVSLFPSLMLQVSKLQAQAIGDFKKLIAPYPATQQKQVYEMSRFPKLINEVASGGPKTPAQIKKILKPYPKEIHSIVSQFATKDFLLFTKINEINAKTDREFAQLIKDYPSEARKAYLVLLQHPTTLNILYKNLGFATLVGKSHGQISAEAAQRLAKLRKDIREENLREQDTQMKKIETDPKSSPALKKAAAVFAKETNYTLSSDADSKGATQVNISFDPYFYGYLGAFGMGLYNYPYWYGFPDWGFDGYY